MLIELLPLRIQSYASSLPSRRLVPKGWQLLKSTVKPRAGGKGEQKSCPWCALMTQSWQQPVCQPAQAASHSWRSFAPVLQSPVPRGWEDWIGAQDCAPIIREILPALNQTQMCAEESRNWSPRPFASKMYFTDMRHERPEHWGMKTATFYKYFTGCYFTLFLFIQFSRCRLHHYMKVWVVASGMVLQDPYWCTYPYSYLFSQSGLTQTVVVPRLSCFWSGETLGSRHPATDCAVELLAPQWAVTRWLICCLHVCLSPPAQTLLCSWDCARRGFV